MERLTTLRDILAGLRDDVRHNRELGDRFERLMQQYFRVDPLYAGLFSEVWMWNEWPLKGRVGDVGIDLVAQEKATCEYCGIQCKFYLPEQTLGKGEIDSFFTALGKPLFSKGIYRQHDRQLGQKRAPCAKPTMLGDRAAILAALRRSGEVHL